MGVFCSKQIEEVEDFTVHSGLECIKNQKETFHFNRRTSLKNSKNSSLQNSNNNDKIQNQFQKIILFFLNEFENVQKFMVSNVYTEEKHQKILRKTV